MISLELYRARIGGWGGRGRSPLSQSPFRKSPFSVLIEILWRISTRLLATTISALLMIGGVELNPGPGSTTEEEISPMDIEDCSQDAFVLSSQTLQRTPISSQVVPLTDLDLLSQCSSDTPMTPEKGFSTPKSRKRKGYRARKDRNRVAIKKRRSDDAEFCQADNEFRLERFNKDCEDSDFLAKHNENQLQDITKRLRDPEKRAEHNKQQLEAMTERLNDPAKRAEHNKHVLERYRSNREEVSSVIISYFSQISQGPTYVCSCCGCLHFRKAVVVLKKEKLVSTNVSNSDFVKQVIIIFNIDIYYNYPLNRNSLEILYTKTLGFKIKYHISPAKRRQLLTNLIRGFFQYGLAASIN